jgi:hypothetical protein
MIFDDEAPIIAVPIPGHDRCFRAQRYDEALAQALRSLEEQDRQRREEPSATIEALFEDAPTHDPLRSTDALDCIESSDNPYEAPRSTPERVGTLRQAGRMLDEAAELLEEQALYDRADELRGMAQQLREDARQGRPQRMPNAKQTSREVNIGTVKALILDTDELFSEPGP